MIGVRSGDDYVPFDESPALSGLGMNTAATIVDEVIAALESQRIRVEQYHPEFGHAQQELTCVTRPGFGRPTSTSCIERPCGPWSSDRGTSPASPPSHGPLTGQWMSHSFFTCGTLPASIIWCTVRVPPLRFSQFAEHFLAGVLNICRPVALTCPSYNSYLRLQPGNRAAAFVSYGLDNREAPVRLVLVSLGKRQRHREYGASRRRLDVQSSTSRWAACLPTGLDGVRRELRPGPGDSSAGDPATAQRCRARATRHHASAAISR